MAIPFDPTGAIVVGTDLSQRAGRAVEWASARAAETGHTLQVVLAIPEVPIPPRSHLFAAMQESDWPGHIEELAEAKLHEVTNHVKRAHPKLAMETFLVRGVPSYTLAQASKTAELVVIGARGAYAPFKVRALGGTADAVVQHAHGPVAVVTDLAEGVESGPIVVGVDDSAEAQAALRWAAAEAATRGVRLHAVHALDLTPWLSAPLGGGAIDPVPLAEGIKDATERQVAPYREQYPELQIDVEVPTGLPEKALLHASEGASLLVVGSRGRGGFTGLLLGSTSKAVLRDAHCPVVILRGDERSVPPA